MSALSTKKIAFIVDDYFEEAELTEPRAYLEEVGAKTVLFAPDGSEVHGMHHAEIANAFKVDRPLTELDVDQFDAVVVPGGVINTDKLRMNKDAQKIITSFLKAGKPTALICHAPWLLASADIAKERTLTSYFTLQDDLRNAGAEWKDETVVIDNNLITSRNPDDIPAFNKAIVNALAT